METGAPSSGSIGRASSTTRLRRGGPFVVQPARAVAAAAAVADASKERRVINGLVGAADTSAPWTIQATEMKRKPDTSFSAKPIPDPALWTGDPDFVRNMDNNY